jgi:LPS sulfotransferase NodH
MILVPSGVPGAEPRSSWCNLSGVGMNIPQRLRDILSPHRDAVEGAFGRLRPKPGWLPPDVDFLFLCFTNRCGSNYLAHLLASTGAFNEAGEFFNAPTVLEHATARGLRSLPAYVAALPALVAHRHRIAAKASIDQLVMLSDAGILPALGGRAHYLLLERQDRLGQAISRVIASQNGRWTTEHASEVPDSALRFDPAAIDEELGKIALGNAGFYLFFSANGIVPVHTTYEAVLADPAPVMDMLAAAMNLPKLEAKPGKIRIGQQANAINAAWRDAYLRKR